jgi:hypothetical protein
VPQFTKPHLSVQSADLLPRSLSRQDPASQSQEMLRTSRLLLIVLIVILSIWLLLRLPNSSSHSLHLRLISTVFRGQTVPHHDLSGSSVEIDTLLARNHHVELLSRCSVQPNKHLQHIRLQNSHLNISFTPPNRPPNADLRLFNPTILPLPSWSTEGKYLIVSRVVTEGLHQRSLFCFADLCIPANSTSGHYEGTRRCTDEDQTVLGSLGGLRCTTEPLTLNIPPTPALQCEGSWSSLPNIPGFHDPRIFWSGQGEPLIILNSASQYDCIGLWIMGLRAASPELEKLVNKHGKHEGPTPSYPHITELTRNPRYSRAAVEKNWMLWFPGNDGEAYIQYNLGSQSTSTPFNVSGKATNSSYAPGCGRSFAKLIGRGFTTENLTSVHELSCFEEIHNYDGQGRRGHWHQGSNSLRLILCSRSQVKAGDCGSPDSWNYDGREVHFAIMHRKFANNLDLPMRYERHVGVWEGRRPFKMIGVSRYPILLHNERAHPWSEAENWPTGKVGNENWTSKSEKRSEWIDHPRDKSSAYFTYTPSLAWAWRSTADHAMALDRRQEDSMMDEDVHQLSQLGTGFLGDEVLVGIGLDDVDQAFAKIKVDALVTCLRLCPGLDQM